MRFKAIYASAAGKRHSFRGIECQDYVLVENTQNSLTAALADGAGSKKYAAESARICCQTAISLVSPITADEAYEMKEGFSNHLNSRFINEVEGFNEEEYGSTLLLLKADTDGHAFWGHIGDGIILLKNKGEWRALSLHDNGSYINETFLIPSKDAYKNFRFEQLCLEPNDTVILVSDGLSDLLYDPAEKKAANVCDILERICRENKGSRGNEIISTELKDFFSMYTDDDMSMIVLSAFDGTASKEEGNAF